jgi:hypothetical protein
MKKIILPIALIIVLLFPGCKTTGSDAENIMTYPIKSVAFNEVNINDSFWSPKLEIIRDITVPDLFDHCEKNGRLDDFLIAGGPVVYCFEGIDNGDYLNSMVLNSNTN